MVNLTNDELEAVCDALRQLVSDGFAEDDSDPIVTALVKIEVELATRDMGEPD